MFTLFANSQVLIKNTNIGPRELGQHRKESSLLAENEGVSRGPCDGPRDGPGGRSHGQDRTGRDGIRWASHSRGGTVVLRREVRAPAVKTSSFIHRVQVSEADTAARGPDFSHLT